MLRSSNQITRKFSAPILSIGGSIVSSAMAGGGAGTPHSPGTSVRAAGSRKIPKGVASTNMLVSHQIQHFSIDAVLIDFHMPKLNGPEAIVELRNMGETMSTNPINPPYQLTLSTHLINPPYQHTISTHLINPPYQPTLSTHLINTPYQPILSIHLINTPHQHAPSTQDSGVPSSA